MNITSIRGNIVDIFNERIFAGELSFDEKKILSVRIENERQDASLPFILPGFIDSHVHIESSMLVPSEFARLAVVHGTVATVSDPHEIANVCGIEGVNYMIENGKAVNFKFYFGAPSCVPATKFETAGAELNSDQVSELLAKPEILYLSEMMNFPGVIFRDAEVLKKIEAAKQNSKPIDGHAPGLRGEDLVNYIAAGISTDHECFTIDEALEKLSLGMKILIREGSAAKNFDELIDLLHDYPNEIMFCSDDKHPDSLVKGHINDLCRRAANRGIDVFKILKAACVNPAIHYKLTVGLLRMGDQADFIVVNNLSDFTVQSTYINGTCVSHDGTSLINSIDNKVINHFNASKIGVSSLFCDPEVYLQDKKIPAIVALEGQLITNKIFADPLKRDGNIISDVDNDILKMAVVNRYTPSAPAIAFVKNFGIKHGAIASSVAHDSHNIIAVGTDDQLIVDAINLVIDAKGGISATDGTKKEVLPLPVGGLMSDKNGYQIAAAYTAIDLLAKSFGTTLSSPFMTLSFMALLVIPSLKLSDKGLFDGDNFRFVYC